MASATFKNKPSIVSQCSPYLVHFEQLSFVIQTRMILSFKYVCSYYLISFFERNDNILLVKVEVSIKITIKILRVWTGRQTVQAEKESINYYSTCILLNSRALKFKFYNVHVYSKVIRCQNIKNSYTLTSFIVPTDIPEHNCQ